MDVALRICDKLAQKLKSEVFDVVHARCEYLVLLPLCWVQFQGLLDL